MGGTRSGSWLIAIGVGAAQMFADPLPPPRQEDLLLLGVAHRGCLETARDNLRRRLAPLEAELPRISVEEFDEHDPKLDMHLPAEEESCPFCQGRDQRITQEDIYPLWLMRELRQRGARVLRDGKPARKFAGPTTATCADCNNTWMSVLENDVKERILSLIEHARPVELSEQRLLALWATMKAILFDAATEAPLIPRYFGHELRIHREPHVGTYVWMAAYGDSSDALTVRRWVVHAKDSEEVIAVCVTFSVFRVAFQVLVTFYDGELSPLEDFRGSVQQVWPLVEAISWPPPFYFDRESIRALACRVYDNREPVVMNVTLQASRVVSA